MKTSTGRGRRRGRGGVHSTNPTHQPSLQSRYVHHRAESSVNAVHQSLYGAHSSAITKSAPTPFYLKFKMKLRFYIAAPITRYFLVVNYKMYINQPSASSASHKPKLSRSLRTSSTPLLSPSETFYRSSAFI